MAVAPQQLAGSLFQGFIQLSNAQKLSLMVGLAAAIALLFGMWMWSQTPDFRILYTNLTDRDGGTIITTLQQMNVPYKVAEGGAIMVPSGQVYDIRLRLASQGLPRGGSVGFELMESQKLGTSQFLEQVNYQRALEGELARSIQSLSAVQGARVHLAIPRPSVFIREQEKPSASILISLFPGRVLDPAQVNGIVHLVSSSVPELPVKNVTVVDQAGNLLSSVANGASSGGLEPGQLDYLHQVEQSYVKRIEAILSPIIGTDNVRAQVAADLDFAQTEQTAETFKPNAAPTDASIRSQQSNETLGGAGQTASGVPGALSNQPPGAASAPLTVSTPPPVQGSSPLAQPAGNTHKESTINYEVDKTIRHVKQPVGAIKRLSVAVVVNFRKATDKAGKVSFKPLSTAEVTQINNLVKEAMGYNQPRGDTLNVVNASFSLGDKEVVPELPVWKEPENISLAKEVLKNLLIAAVAFYLVFGVLRPLLKELAKPRVKPSEAVEISEETEEYAEKVKVQAGYEENLRAAKELAKLEPKIVASVVKEWVEGA